MTIELIRAGEADKEYLLALRKLTMVEHLERAGLYLSDDEHLLRVNEAYKCSYLIIHLGEKVGLIKYRELANMIEVMQLQIHPSCQGKGIGRTVMLKVIELSRQKNKRIELAVLKDNPAKLLYQRLGFLTVSEDDHEYYLQLECQ